MNVTGEIIQESCIFEWEVLSLPRKVGDVCYSPEFEFGGGTWTIVMYPNGDDDEGWMALFLCKRRSKCSKHVVSFELSVKDKDGQHYGTQNSVKTVFDENGSTWGFGKFMFRSKLSEKMIEIQPENVLIVSCSVSWDRCVAEADQQTIDPSVQEIAQYPTASSVSEAALSATELSNDSKSSKPKILWKALNQNFKDLFLSQKDCDVTIKIQDQEFQAHRIILKARSTVFAAMFEHDLAEKLSDELEITDAEPGVFRDLLLYMYSGEVEKLCSENASELYVLADKYDLCDLKEECMKFIEGNLSVDNVCKAFVLADKYVEVKLNELAREFLKRNRAAVIANEKWKKLEKENLLLVIDLLKSIVLDNK